MLSADRGRRSRREMLALGLALPPALVATTAFGHPALPDDSQPPHTALPLPETARGPAIPRDKGYLVEEIRGGVYWVTNGIYQAMFLVTGEGVIAVDAPPLIGQNYLKAIADVTSEPVRWVIYSHSHNDHIGAAGMFPGDPVYIAHQEVAAKLARVGATNRPLPHQTFADSYTLAVGNQTLVLDYPGPNHEPGNIFIYAPHQKVLMAVDIVFPGWAPFKELAVSHDIPGWVAAHDRLLEYDFDTLVAGHMTRLGTPEDVRIQREYVHDLRANAARALQTVDITAVARKTGFENPWLLNDAHMAAVAKAAAEATLVRWGGRLGALDVVALSHASAMADALRLDF